MVSADDIFNASILIVDDQESNIQLLKELLIETGYRRITSTTDPYAVRALYQNNRFDLILLDLQMPGMDGFQVMADLQNIEAHDSYVPVLVLTAQPAHKLQALIAGAKDFLSKPFDLIEVKTRIHNMLEVRLLYQQLQNYNQMLEITVQDRTAELGESEARFRRFTELSSDCYWEQDEHGNFTHAYGPILEMLGSQSNISKDAADGTPAGHWDTVDRTELEANIAARRPFLDFIYSRMNADGTNQYFQVSGEPMFDASSRFTGYRGVAREVTEIMNERSPSKAA